MRSQLLACVLLVLSAAPASAQISTRKSVDELTAAEVISLRRGVMQMRAWSSAPKDSADYRRSWAYWSNMHGHFDADCYPGPTPAPGMDGQVAVSASTTTERQTWCQCAHESAAFLTWHRMYLYFFEQVLQAAANDPTLRLPYWDTSAARRIPAILREPQWLDQGVVKPNPLHTPLRRAALNEGSGQLAQEIVDTEGAFAQSRFEDFAALLEEAPHGNVHCAIGIANCGTGLMGHPATAAQDPIFWLHHANIDRLYECWLQGAATRYPNDPAHLNLRFYFPDAAGQIRQARVGDMLTLTQLKLRYTKPGACPASAPASDGGFLNVAADQTFTIAGPGRISQGLANVPLSIAEPAKTALKSSPFQSLGGRRTELRIRGLSYGEVPSTILKAFLERTDGKRGFLGTINFFSGARAHAAAHGPEKRDIRIDATKALASIMDGGKVPDGIKLVVVPSTGVAGEGVDVARALISPSQAISYDQLQLVVKD